MAFFNNSPSGNGSSGSESYDFGAQFSAEPGTSTVFGRVMIPRAITLPADFASAAGNVDTNPTSSYAIDVQDDGVSIGTITVSTGGAFTFVTTSNEAKVVAAGSVITFVSPSGADGTVAGLSVAFQATEV